MRTRVSFCSGRLLRLGGAFGGGAGVCDEAPEEHWGDSCKSDDAGSLPQPPSDDGVSALDRHRAHQGRCYSGDQDDVAQDPEGLWRAGSRSRQDQDEAKGDSGRGDDVEGDGSDGVLGDPGEAGGGDETDGADGDDEQADHEGQSLQDVLLFELLIPMRHGPRGGVRR